MKRIIRMSLALLMPLLALMASGAAFAQELPPGPTVVSRSSLPGQTINGEFELINIMLDFDPGAATPPHTHGGPGMVTVLSQEMVFGMEGKPDMVLKSGEVYHDLPGMVHTAANKGASTSRVSYMVALPKGAALTTVVGVAEGTDLPPGPKTIYRNSLPGLTMQGEFEMINLILDFAPGSATPLHRHGGPGIVTVIEGELVFAPEGQAEIVGKPGDVYLDLPGTHHTAVNKSGAPARVSYAVLLPTGATLTTVAAASAPAPAPAQAPAPAPAPVEQPASAPTEFVGMPSTGEGDYNLVVLVALVVAAGLIFEGMSRLLRTGGIRPRD